MITTKTGDQGYTSILGKRLKKTDPLVHLIGTLDEALALAGSLSLLELQDAIKYALDTIAQQKDIPKEKISILEEKISSYNFEFKGFVRPVGKSAQIHLLRAIIRRAERYAWASLNNNIPIYLNRLSDLTFLIAIEKSKEWNEFQYF